MSANSKLPRKVYTSRANAKIANGPFSTPQKQALLGAARARKTIYVQEADAAAVTDTTLINPATLYIRHYCEAGRRYRVEVLARMTQGTSARGTKLGINLTGTQTTAECFGASWLYDEENSALTTGVVALSSGAYSANDAANTASTYNFNFYLKPQNDGYLTIQYAGQNGTGTAVLKKGSIMTVEEIE